MTRVEWVTEKVISDCSKGQIYSKRSQKTGQIQFFLIRGDECNRTPPPPFFFFSSLQNFRWNNFYLVPYLFTDQFKEKADAIAMKAMEAEMRAKEAEKQATSILPEDQRMMTDIPLDIAATNESIVSGFRQGV